MFGSRRRRAASNPPLNARTANPNAATAAASAFLKDRASNVSLSSAAAAAALRARPTTPISVADVQTKRTLRRENSNSSAGSSNAGGRRGPPGAQLQRTGSSGSMTERTFRSPSPSRSKGVPSAPDAPPVPAIPADMQQPPLPQKSHRRAASTEARRVASPPPQISHGRGSSLGPGPQGQHSKNQRGPGLSRMQELTGVERPASRGSVNFSLPTNLRPTSPDGKRPLTSFSTQSVKPTGSATVSQQNMVYDPNTRTFLPKIEVLNITQGVQDAANQAVKKAKRIAPNQATGTHLEDGTVGGRIRGTAVNAPKGTERKESEDAQPRVPDPTPAPKVVSNPEPQPSLATARDNQGQAVPEPRAKKTRLVPQHSGLGMAVVDDSDSDQPYGVTSSDDDRDAPLRSAKVNNYGGAKLSKKPSVVREDREREEEEDDTPKRGNQLSVFTKPNSKSGATPTTSPTSLPRSRASRGHAEEKLEGPVSASQPDSTPEVDLPTAPLAHVSQDGLGDNVGAVGVASAVSNGIKNERMHSVSPVRATHFAMAPDSLMVRHQPPARSVSPRKSALKQSNSPRGPSPVPGVYTDDPARPLSETSNDPSLTNEDQTRARKKAARVSFDESNVAVIEPPANTDSPASNQAKRPWFSLGRGKKKDAVISETEDDEVMKPRPALPSFGSVRERKKTETPERQLVKPTDPTQAKATHILSTTPLATLSEHALGQSSDYLAGAILVQDAASKNEANISKSREPLPPEVTSVEGSGYHSDSESSVSSGEHVAEAVPAAQMEYSPDRGQVEAYTALTSETLASVKPPASVESQKSKAEIPATNGVTPKINIVHPSPTIQTTPRRPMSPMPGSWDNSGWGSADEQNEDDIPTPKASPLLAPQHPIEPTPALAGIAEPTPEVHKPVVHETAAESLHPAAISMQHPEDSDTSSIYSDAAEDLSDPEEGDGFLSLDAVVESPVVAQSLGLPAFASPPESPTAKYSKDRAGQKPTLTAKSSEPALDEGWGKAQEYWKGLTADKRRQLEQEAQHQSDDSDTEVEAKPLPKAMRQKRAAVVPGPVEVPRQRQTAPRQQRAYQIAPGTKAPRDGPTPVIRSSMRAAPAVTAPETHIRKSMRGSDPVRVEQAVVAPETHIRKSMRGADSMRGSLRESTDFAPVKGSLQKKYRPMSSPSTGIKADQAAVKQHVKALSAASAAITSPSASKSNAPPLLRRKSSAESDSSFKRTRPSSEGFSLRRSMRGPEPAAMHRQPSPMRTGGFSLRSPATTGTSSTRTPFAQNSSSGTGANSIPTQTHMRASMRSSFGDTGPTLRGHAAAPSNRGKSPLRIPGFGRSSSAKPAKAIPVLSRASRFADSSDEEDNQPAFRSRFVDSSDEEDGNSRPQKATTLPRTMRSSQPQARATPQRTRTEDRDSSDLPDSDDEKTPHRSHRFSPGLGRVNKTRLTNGLSTTNGTSPKPTKQGLALSSGSLRRTGSGRGTLASPSMPSTSQARTTTTISGPPLTAQRPEPSRRTSSFMAILRRKKKDPNPNTKVRKSEAESPARRDTRLERSESELKAVRQSTGEEEEGRFADADVDVDKKEDGQGKMRMGMGLRTVSASSWGFGASDRPKSPRLQKRRTLSREVSSNSAMMLNSSWPLPQPLSRTFSAEGSGNVANGGEHAGVGKDEERGFTGREERDVVHDENDHENDPENESMSGAGVGGVSGGSESARKKKKFGKLRRMFGLDE